MMKRLIFMALLTIGSYAVALSQETPKPVRYYSTEAMDEINATPEQRAAVTELADRYKTMFKELRGNKDSFSAEDYKTERKKLTSARAKEYREIITPEQLKQLRAKDKAYKEWKKSQ